MKRRRATSRKPAKVQQTINAKRGTAPKAARNRRLSKSKDAEVARLARERDESLEREKAAAEVLRVISSSPGELQPVFEAILKNATSICAAELGLLHLHENGAFRRPATYNAPPAFAQALAQREPLHGLAPIWWTVEGLGSGYLV